MISQAGLYGLTLYENKGFSFDYNANNTVDEASIINTGEIYSFETNDNRNNLFNEIRSANNNEIINDYTINLWISGLTQDNLDTIEELQRSIYGWIPVLEFMDNQKYLINEPFFQAAQPFNSQISHTFKVDYKPRITTLKKLEEIT